MVKRPRSSAARTPTTRRQAAKAGRDRRGARRGARGRGPRRAGGQRRRRLPGLALARTRDKSPQLLAAFLAASGVLAREAPASFPASRRWRGRGGRHRRRCARRRDARARVRSLSAARAAVHESNFASRSPAVGLRAGTPAPPRRGRAPRTAAALSDLASFVDGAAPRGARGDSAPRPLIALFAELAAAAWRGRRKTGPASPRRPPGSCATRAGAPRGALLADRFSCPLGAAA